MAVSSLDEPIPSESLVPTNMKEIGYTSSFLGVYPKNSFLVLYHHIELGILMNEFCILHSRPDDNNDDGKRILIKRGQVRFFTDQPEEDRDSNESQGENERVDFRCRHVIY
uniref:Uncharacterized protein n=1 Tax=Vespula pensylvanica TaxID=30213 RepID=A0A834UBQ4_VESPE|nr:hypothetical protein H0235_005924 [Vespula pensylvanica]